MTAAYLEPHERPYRHVDELARLRAINAELLDALKDWDNAICNGFDDYEGRMTGRRVLIKTRALIAKAQS